MNKNNELTDIINIISNVTNPVAKKTLGEEKRIVEVAQKQELLEIVYKRDSIDPQSKRVIEDHIIDALKGLWPQEKIRVKTVSGNSAEVYQESGKKPADLKVGHGPQGAPKKKVENVGRVIAVSSAKGGVGKSTVTVNLAMALKNQGKKVGIIDADIYGPSIPLLMGLRNAQPQAREDKKILPFEAHGIKFMSFGLFIGEAEPVIWRGPMLGGVLNQFLFDVAWEELDYLLIDLPPGTGDMQLSMVQATDIDGAIVVSTPQNVALLDATKGLKMFESVKVPILGMVENMSYFVPDDMQDKKYAIFGEGGVKYACKELGVNFLAEIPLEIALRESCDFGKPYMANPDHEGRAVWKAYYQFAQKVDQHFNGASKKGLMGRLFNKG